MRRIIFNLLDNKLQVSTVIRIWIISIISYTVYKSYKMGWTNSMLLSESDPFNSWTARALYLNKGLESLLHLNIVSMIMSTSLLVLPMLLLVLLINPNPFLDGGKKTYVIYATLFMISIYTFIRIDTPSNYYASRYFLPLLVPAIIILFIMIISKIRCKVLIISILIIVVAFFNFKYIDILQKEKVFQERFNLISEVSAIIPEGEYLFIYVDSTFSERLLAPNLNYSGINVILVKDNDGGYNFNEKINMYASELNLEKAFILSSEELTSQANIIKTINFNDKRFPWSILYPTTVTEKNYIYNIYLKKFVVPITNKKIMMGSTEASIYIKDGFSFPEGENEVSWRWSEGIESRLEVPLVEDSSYSVKLNMAPYPMNKNQIIDVYLNDELIESIVLEPKYEFKEYNLILSNHKVKSSNVITLKYDYIYSPGESNNSGDKRKLAVAYNYIYFQENK